MQIPNRHKKEAGTWKWGILALVLLAPFFFLTYGFANQYASGLSHVPSIVFAWEQQIPLWPWTIVPYWSIDLFYGLSLLLCWTKFELKQQAFRLFSAQLISISCFLLFPLKFSFERPELHGFFGMWFDLLMGFDKPFNQAPSLHIVLLVILWDFYRRHVSGKWKYLVDFWSFLIGISVLTTWQHHFIDIPTGLWVGAFCLWLFPLNVLAPWQKDSQQPLTPKHWKLASYYCITSILFALCAWFFKPIGLWLLYPAISLLLVSFAYFTGRPHCFQKQQNGQMSMASILLFAPYFVFAWLNSRAWTKKHPEDSFILQISHYEIYLGRIPTPSHLKNHYVAFFDCCAELPTSSKIQRQQFYSLDLIPLSANQLAIAVEHFSQLIQQHPHETSSISSKKLFISCALGYSRSSSILAAYLLKSGHATSVDAAIQIVQNARPWIVLKDVQRQQLHLYQLKLQGLAP